MGTPGGSQRGRNEKGVGKVVALDREVRGLGQPQPPKCCHQPRSVVFEDPQNPHFVALLTPSARSASLLSHLCNGIAIRACRDCLMITREAAQKPSTKERIS